MDRQMFVLSANQNEHFKAFKKDLQKAFSVAKVRSSTPPDRPGTRISGSVRNLDPELVFECLEMAALIDTQNERLSIHFGTMSDRFGITVRGI